MRKPGPPLFRAIILSISRFFAFIAALTLLWAGVGFAQSAALPASIESRLLAGQAVDLIVEYQSQAVEQAAATMRQRAGLVHDDAGILALKAQRYQAIKLGVDRTIARPGIEMLRDYSHLPMAYKRFHSMAALRALLANPAVKAVYPNREFHPVLAVSLPFIGQPAVASAADRGNGTTVAVIDNGIDYTRSAFGSCTAPGTPASCHVVASVNFGTGTTDTSHGTNVSAIALGVAPDSRIAMLNAFSGASAYTSDVISAMNWAIANQSTYHIAAINMSLGDGSRNTAPCSSGNPFLTPVGNARSAGISVVAAAGNDAYADAIANPACTPGVISVGAVYDANYGGINWGAGLCSDATTRADQIACFSNSANFLSLLAPGALVTAGGYTEGGTSQASPHVAGAVAVLRSAFATETLDQTASRLTGNGVALTDPRNGIVKPRLNLLAATRPANDDLVARFMLGGSTGSTAGLNRLATTESGEPSHAGNAGSRSVWWKWAAPATGQVSLDTHGSSFDTLLAVYEGTAINALTSIAANDNDGAANGVSSLLFQAQSGAEYEIAVDGANGASGDIALNWALNTAAQANLSVNIAGPASGATGSTAAYSISVSNAGPQAATNVSVSTTLPADASFVEGAAGCAVSGTVVTCPVGTLQAGATAALNITVMWGKSGGTATLSVSVASDLPDSATANNTTSVAVNIAADSADIPVLPQWGVGLMAILLMSLILWPRRQPS